MTSISFHRRYLNYTGGHQKFADYLSHCLSIPNLSVQLYADNQSLLEPNLFKYLDRVTYQTKYSPDQADIAFLAGMDWQEYLRFYDEKQPKIGLIQHVRHGDPNHPLFQFLQYKAVRICVSQAVHDAIVEHANGPCIVIKMGHFIPTIRTFYKRYDLYILGNKQPGLARELSIWANSRGLNVKVHEKYVEKHEVLEAMAQSRVTLTLPNKSEGFYLPGIEAMALSDWAIVPNCIANAEYMRPGVNALSCELNLNSCINAIEVALKLINKPSRFIKKIFGKQLVKQYSLNQERLKFTSFMKDFDFLWSNATTIRN